LDQRVEPLLEVLVARAIEEAQVEIYEDDRAMEIKKKMKEISIKRRGRLLMVQRRMYQKSRYEQENEKRRLERMDHYDDQLEVHKKLYAREFVKDKFRKGMFADVLKKLKVKKVLGTDRVKDIEIMFDGKIVTGTSRLLEEKKSRTLLFKKIIGQAMQSLEGLHKKIKLQKKNELMETKKLADELKQLKELKEKEKVKKQEEEKKRSEYQEIANKMFSELESIKSFIKFSNCENLQSVNIWKQDLKSDETNQYDLFGEAINSLMLLSIKTMEYKRKILKKSQGKQKEQEIPQNFFENEIIKNVLTSMDKLTEKWVKTFPQLKFELPLSTQLKTLLENYEQLLWQYLGLKEIVVNSKWPLESPEIDLPDLENKLVEYAQSKFEDSTIEVKDLKIQHLIGFIVDLEKDKQKELLLSYFFNTDNKPIISKSGSPVKLLMDNIQRYDEFCKSQKFFNFLYEDLIEQKNLGLIESFLIENKIFTKSMWIEIIQTLFKQRINLLKKDFQIKIKKYKQDYKNRVSQTKKDSKGNQKSIKTKLRIEREST
jgi:hypothetical protein